MYLSTNSIPTLSIDVMYFDVRKVSDIKAKLYMCMNLSPRLEQAETLLTDHEKVSWI
jgi:hypothetical protein